MTQKYIAIAAIAAIVLIAWFSWFFRYDLDSRFVLDRWTGTVIADGYHKYDLSAAKRGPRISSTGGGSSTSSLDDVFAKYKKYYDPLYAGYIGVKPKTGDGPLTSPHEAQ